ncbi:MAG: hypothetical protein ACKERG_02995 [Candidatus Hodgkinia cicadicola]
MPLKLICLDIGERIRIARADLMSLLKHVDIHQQLKKKSYFIKRETNEIYKTHFEFGLYNKMRREVDERLSSKYKQRFKIHSASAVSILQSFFFFFKICGTQVIEENMANEKKSETYI